MWAVRRLVYQLQGVQLAQDFDFEDMCVKALSDVFDKLDGLRALEVERRQFRAIDLE